MSVVASAGTARPLAPGRLVLYLVAVAVVAGLGSLATQSGVDGWYRSADRPWFTPPNWVFAPVWSVLYLAMAVAAWCGDRAGASMRWWWLQLVLNLAWTPVFFAAQWLWAGLGVIVLLLVAIVATMRVFAPHSRLALWLLVPYLAWVAYATALNTGLAVLN